MQNRPLVADQHERAVARRAKRKLVEWATDLVVLRLLLEHDFAMRDAAFESPVAALRRWRPLINDLGAQELHKRK